ncbi:MAG: hypothetical protein J6X50_04940 [Bacilli bacterium]|nr:hypothetical protein [Bacilli bacterium]
MKYLSIKVTYKINDEEGTSEACIPYVLDSVNELPDIYPFNQNYYFGPDTGTFLGRLYITKDGKLDYFDNIIELNKDGKTIYKPTKTDRYIFEFAIIEK